MSWLRCGSLKETTAQSKARVVAAEATTAAMRPTTEVWRFFMSDPLTLGVVDVL
jgi:hypothetical protein